MPLKKKASEKSKVKKAATPAKKPSAKKSSSCCSDHAHCGAVYAPEKKSSSHQKTRVVIKYDVGFNNSVFIRGKGANLSWEKGISLKNTKPDEWVWETDLPFTTCEFKVLINDDHYENGENHPLACGKSLEYTPQF